MNKIIYISLVILLGGCVSSTPQTSPNINKIDFKDVDSSISSRSESQNPFLFLCECKK